MSSKGKTIDVESSVTKLQELADRLESSDVGFRKNDVASFDEVINTLYWLEAERKRMRTLFETESIKSCKVRHKLQTFPNLPWLFADEFCANAINAVKKAKANRRVELQEIYAQKTDNIIVLKEDADTLEDENVQLEKERELLREKFRETVAALNVVMSERTQGQILLNESVTDMQEISKEIMDMEEDIIVLREELIEEVAQISKKLHPLHDLLDGVRKQLEMQKEKNFRKKSEILEAQNRLRDQEDHIRRIRNNILESEKSCSDLEKKEQELELYLQKLRNMKEDELRRRAEMKNDRLSDVRSLEESTKKLLNDIALCEKQYEAQLQQTPTLNRQANTLLWTYGSKKEKQNHVASLLKEAKDKLHDMEQNLKDAIQQLDMLKFRNELVRRAIRDLHRHHGNRMVQLELITGQLENELAREEALTAPYRNTYKRIQDELKALKADLEQVEGDIAQRVDSGQEKMDSLDQEEAQLKLDIQQREQEIESLCRELAFTRSEVEDSLSYLNLRLQALKNGIDTTTRLIIEGRTKIHRLNQVKKLKEKLCEMQANMTVDEYFMQDEELDENVQFEMLRGDDHGTLEALRMLQEQVKELESEASTVSLSSSVEGVELMVDIQTGEFKAFLSEVRVTASQEHQLRIATLTKEERDDLQELEQALEDRKQQLEDERPGFLELKRFLQKRMDEHQQRQKIADEQQLKYKRLQETLEAAKRERAAGMTPNLQLREQIKLQNKAYLQQMLRHKEDTSSLEEQIFSTGCKVRALMDANEELDKTCDKRAESVASMAAQKIWVDEQTSLFPGELSRLLRELRDLRAEVAAMIKSNVARGNEVVQALNHPQECVAYRGNVTRLLGDMVTEKDKFFTKILDDIIHTNLNVGGKKSRTKRKQVRMDTCPHKRSGCPKGGKSKPEVKGETVPKREVSDCKENLPRRITSASGENPLQGKASASRQALTRLTASSSRQNLPKRVTSTSGENLEKRVASTSGGKLPKCITSTCEEHLPRRKWSTPGENTLQGQASTAGETLLRRRASSGKQKRKTQAT